MEEKSPSLGVVMVSSYGDIRPLVLGIVKSSTCKNVWNFMVVSMKIVVSAGVASKKVVLLYCSG